MMGTLTFELPTAGDREDVLGFYREFEASGGSCIGMGGYADFDRWLTGMHNRHKGRNLPEGYVRENFYLCRENGALVGVFSLKFELTEYLLHFGGHVGYAVRPACRNRGLATRMLHQGMDIARGFGFDKLLCICDDDNYASEKVIVNNGGTLENELYDPEEAVTVKRYWIAL